jgi:hypothetical protein
MPKYLAVSAEYLIFAVQYNTTQLCIEGKDDKQASINQNGLRLCDTIYDIAHGRTRIDVCVSEARASHAVKLPPFQHPRYFLQVL